MYANALYRYESYLVMKYQNTIRNRGIIWILVLLAVLFFSYAVSYTHL